MYLVGKCHCGNISFTLDWKDGARVPARACGCAFCRKHGGVWTSNPAGTLKVRIRDGEAKSEYRFGTRTATFHVCDKCGCVPFVTSKVDGHRYGVVNVNMFENVEEAQLDRRPADFEGESLAKRLARRKRSWIPTVSIGR